MGRADGLSAMRPIAGALLHGSETTLRAISGSRGWNTARAVCCIATWCI